MGRPLAVRRNLLAPPALSSPLPTAHQLHPRPSHPYPHPLQIVTKTFGRCADAALLAGPLKFVNNQARSFPLCTSAPWWNWRLAIRTAAQAGAGTDGAVEVESLRCGTFTALNKIVSLSQRCASNIDEIKPCFEL